jgi:esterase/lipase superfamily enzyme
MRMNAPRTPLFARIIAAGVAVVLLAGCAETLMPTPVGFDKSGGNPFVETPPSMQSTSLSVLVAADRKPTIHDVTRGDPPSQSGVDFFTNERDTSMQFGRATIEFAAHEPGWDYLVKESRTEDRRSDPILKMTRYEPFGSVWVGMPPLDETPPEAEEAAITAFAEAVNAGLSVSHSKDIYVFIHGFNTSFVDNMTLGAEMFHYLGRDGVFINYGWPSQDSLFDYSADKSTASYSTRPFRLLLTRLAKRSNVERIHILAHSAGAPIAVEALRQLRLMHFSYPTDATRTRYKIGRLVLVAPDMDLGDFGNAVADGATAVPERTTIYISSHDKALDISAWMGGFARLGQPMSVLTPKNIAFLGAQEGVDIVDVFLAERMFGSWLGHSYFHDDPWVSTDVLLTLKHGLLPDARGLVRDAKESVFTFPADYPAKAAAAALRVCQPAPAVAPAVAPVVTPAVAPAANSAVAPPAVDKSAADFNPEVR